MLLPSVTRCRALGDLRHYVHHNQPTARFQYPIHFSQCCTNIMPVMGRITADNNIKCVIGKWQTFGISWRVVIFFSCRASAACATTSSMWADKSYATTALTFCAAPNVGLPCGRPDIPYLSGLPGLNSTSSGL